MWPSSFLWACSAGFPACGCWNFPVPVDYEKLRATGKSPQPAGWKACSTWASFAPGKAQSCNNCPERGSGVTQSTLKAGFCLLAQALLNCRCMNISLVQPSDGIMQMSNNLACASSNLSVPPGREFRSACIRYRSSRRSFTWRRRSHWRSVFLVPDRRQQSGCGSASNSLSDAAELNRAYQGDAESRPRFCFYKLDRGRANTHHLTFPAPWPKTTLRSCVSG